MQQRSLRTAAESGGGSVDLAVLSKRLESIARRMAHTLHRTGRSGLINTARDLSCCIVSARHELVTEAESLPSHVLVGPDIMSRTMVEFHPRLRRGDAFLHNSPYHGNSHAADHTIMVPVIDDDDVHRFTVFAKAHQADIGNSIPTTYGAAKDVYAPSQIPKNFLSAFLRLRVPPPDTVPNGAPARNRRNHGTGSK